MDGEVARQHAGKRALEARGVPGGWRFERYLLADGVHARIGAAGADHANRTVEQAAETSFEDALDGTVRGLDLVAVESRAVVFDGGAEPYGVGGDGSGHDANLPEPARLSTPSSGAGIQ